MRQRVEHRVGGRARDGVRRFGARLMRPPSRRSPSKRLAQAGAAPSRGSSRGQHARAPCLAALRRRAGGLGRRIERPAEMLARVPHADARAVMREHLVVVRRATSASCSVERRRARAPRRSRGSARAGPAATAGPARRGRPSRRRRPTRRAPRARVATSTMSPLTTTGIDDRVLDGADRRPVGLPGVELAARAAMHGDQLHARRLGAARELRRVARCVVPAEPHLQRDRDRDRARPSPRSGVSA